jgi:hypothetical protein
LRSGKRCIILSGCRYGTDNPTSLGRRRYGVGDDEGDVLPLEGAGGTLLGGVERVAGGTALVRDTDPLDTCSPFGLGEAVEGGGWTLIPAGISPSSHYSTQEDEGLLPALDSAADSRADSIVHPAARGQHV